MDDLTTIKGIGKATAKKLVAEGIATFAALAQADAKALSNKPGFGAEVDVAAWIAEAEKLVAAGETDEHAKTLLGSNLLPSEIEIAENMLVQLGDVVARAYKDSGLDLEAWNALADADREERLAQAVEAMKLEAATASQTNTQRESGTAREASSGQPLPGDGDIGDLKQGVQPAPAPFDSGGSVPAASAADPADDDEKGLIEVTGPKKGRWRAGMYFTREPRVVEVTFEQLQMIQADPVLTWIPAARPTE
tara:strand:- start:32559 stop:33308 length:750 start_codon:yes stop_codon:yes gene_type:complete